MRVFIGHSFTPLRREIAARLAADPTNTVFTFDPKGQPLAPGVQAVSFAAGGREDFSSPLTGDFQTKMARAAAAAQAAMELRAMGFTPDVICGEASAGDTLFLKDVWPNAHLVTAIDWLYRAETAKADAAGERDEADFWALRARNAVRLLALDAADAAVTGSYWQSEQLPAAVQAITTAIPVGVDTRQFQPDPRGQAQLARLGTLRAGDEVITFHARILEAARGYPVFMRALPQVLRARPNARVVIMGFLEGADRGTVKGPSSDPTYRSVMGQLDQARVQFVSRPSTADRARLMQVSAAHVYLTQPSPVTGTLFEAMASGCTIVASDVAPVREFIEHGRTGVLGAFETPEALAEMLIAVLANADQTRAMRAGARDLAVDRYDVRDCVVPQYLSLIGRLR